MAPATPDVVVAAGNLLGESPVYDARDGALWWIDIHGRSLHRYTDAHGHGAWPLAETFGSIGLADGGTLVGATRTGFVQVDRAGATSRTFDQPLAGRIGIRFNDGRCDRRGRFWSATVSERREVGTAALYRLASDGCATIALDGLTVGNGIAWSPDDRTMYVADSHARTIDAFAFDPDDGVLTGRRPFARFEEGSGLPDGATVDAEGALWIAAIHGGRVLRYAPDGRLDREIRMPCSQPTSCSFGGPGLRTMYVTSARMRLDDAALAREPHAGSLFAIDVGVAGLPEPRFVAEAA